MTPEQETEIRERVAVAQRADKTGDFVDQMLVSIRAAVQDRSDLLDELDVVRAEVARMRSAAADLIHHWCARRLSTAWSETEKLVHEECARTLETKVLRG